MEECLLVRILQIDASNEDEKVKVDLNFGPYSHTLTSLDETVGFPVNTHAKLFFSLQVNVGILIPGWFNIDTCLDGGRANMKIKNLQEAAIHDLQLFKRESSFPNLDELGSTRLPGDKRDMRPLGQIRLHLSMVPWDAVPDDGSIVKIDTRTHSDPVQGALYSIVSLVRALTVGVENDSLTMTRSLFGLREYYAHRPNLPSYEHVVENQTDPHTISFACKMFPFTMASLGWIGVSAMGYGKGLKDLIAGSDFNERSIIAYLRRQSPNVAILKSSFASKSVFQPSFVLLHCLDMDAIIVAMRCSLDVADFITDAVCQYEEFNTHGVLSHSGVMASARWVFDQVLPIINEHKGTVKNLYLSGHSLGGGMASLLTMMLCDDQTVSSQFNIKCAAFAPPATVSFHDPKYDEIIDVYVHNDDVVPRLSYGAAVDLQTLQRYYAMVLSDPALLYSTNDQYKYLDICREALKEHSSSLKLVHPGRVHILTMIDNVGMAIDVPNDYFTEIRFSPAMILDHLPHMYGIVLDSLQRMNE